MTLPKPSLVIFDMDGTTVRHLNPALLTVLEKADDALYQTRLFFSRIGQKLGVAQAWRVRRAARKPRLLVHRTLHKLRRKPVEQIVEPCPGIIDLLELFAANNIATGLLSNGLGKGYGHDILSTFDLEKLFTVTVFREDSTRAKPDPEPLIELIRRLDHPLNDQDVIWYIGDRAKDVVAALRATTHTPARIVPIGYGLHAAGILFDLHYNADHLILSYEEWYPVVQDILAKVGPERVTAKDKITPSLPSPFPPTPLGLRRTSQGEEKIGSSQT